jgi:hypothetical protein
MNPRSVIDTRLLALGLMVFFVFGCTTARGDLGLDWVSAKPVPYAPVNIAPPQGTPPHEPAQQNHTEHVYRYYPASEVYYDTARRIYFYIEGGAWESDALLPYRLRLSLGRYETVKVFSDTPYEYHAATFKKTYRVLPRQAKQDEHGVLP